MMARRSPVGLGSARLPLIGALLVLLAAGPLTAQEVSVRTYLSQEAVGVGRTFVLNLEIAGSQDLDSEPQLPELGSFATYLGSGTSTSMQIVNNRTTVSLTIQYRYQALQEGTFEIPGITVGVEGETYTTEPLSLTVSEAPPPAQQQQPRPMDPAEIPPEDLFLTAEVSRSRVLEGEPIVVEYRIFTRVNVSSYGFTRIPEPEGFWVEELPLPEQPQVEQVVREGRQYTSAVIRRVAVIPTGPGERTLEPLGIEAQVRVRQRMMDPFESIFDLDRSSLFGTVVPVAVSSSPVSIQVDPLPPGRPDPFSGVVGSLSLSATLDPDSVDANEALTLRITAMGEGNLRAVPEPTLELPGDFEVYPPEVSESVQRSGGGLRGTKSWEYVLIPRAPGNRIIPPLSFGYFDTQVAEFGRASTAPLELTVSGEAMEGTAGLVRGGVATLREDIRFIHLEPARLMRTDRSPVQGPAFWSLLFLPMLMVLGAAGIRLHQDRLEGDPAYARRRRAGRIAHARLSEARRLASGDSRKEFYAEVARALTGFIADKLNVPAAGLQRSAVEDGLKGQGVSETTLEEVLACLEHSDLQRFSPPSGDSGTETRFLERVSKVMTELNREMGR
jgi:hypothetical protein